MLSVVVAVLLAVLAVPVCSALCVAISQLLLLKEV